MNNFIKALHEKGWTAKAVAERWGMTATRVSQIGKNPKQIHWDALAGLKDLKVEHEIDCSNCKAVKSKMFCSKCTKGGGR